MSTSREPSIESIPEWAPSEMREDQPTVARWLGAIGLILVTLGSSTLFATTAMSRVTMINPQLAFLCFVVGMVLLLYHAASDPDLQLRRVYSSFGLAWLVMGVLFAVVPYKGVTGGLFLPYGMVGLFLGLCFCMAGTRHETDTTWYNGVAGTLACIGAAAALVGFIGGNNSLEFLLPRGFLFILFGLMFLWAFVGLKGADDPIGYRIGWLLGLIGAAGLTIALVRSAMAPKDYPMPAGMLLGAGSLLYLMVALGVCSDNQLVVMTRRELASFFYSPIAYIIFLCLTLVAWGLFILFINTLVDPLGRPRPRVEPMIGSYLLAWVPVICVIFMVPVLTMRLLSEEHRTNTIEVMLTVPLGETSIVLSKFLGAFLFYLLLWMPWGLFLVALRFEGGRPFDYRPLLSFYLALAFMASGFVAMGLFFSSLTKNQITAAVMTFVGMMVPVAAYIANANQLFATGSIFSSIISHTSFIELWINAIDGKIFFPDLMVHASVAVLWLYLTIKVLEARKWS